ncbi:MAG: hypothetical protein ACTS3F_03870 [Phycisphaerales bacterium]
MAKGQDLSRHQRKIVDRYYEHKDTIVARRLSEIASDLFVVEAGAAEDGDGAASGRQKSGALWKRAETALKGSKLPEERWRAIIDGRDTKGLAALAVRLMG